VPDGWALVVGQRVVAPLGRANRTGVVAALHYRDDAAGLKALLRVVETVPVLDAEGLALARWIADQSLSSLGGTLAALLPPVVPIASEGELGMKRGGSIREGSRLRSLSSAGANPKA